MSRYEPRARPISTPRNRPGAARGQEWREKIEAFLRARAAEDPTARPPTAKDIRKAQDLPLAVRTIQYHLKIIRAR